MLYNKGYKAHGEEPVTPAEKMSPNPEITASGAGDDGSAGLTRRMVRHRPTQGLSPGTVAASYAEGNALSTPTSSTVLRFDADHRGQS